MDELERFMALWADRTVLPAELATAALALLTDPAQVRKDWRAACWHFWGAIDAACEWQEMGVVPWGDADR